MKMKLNQNEHVSNHGELKILKYASNNSLITIGKDRIFIVMRF